jgi:ATP-dependent DNA ligase
MKTRTDSSSSLIKKVKSWKKDQAIISLDLDEMIKTAKDKKIISEQKVDGQTGIMEYKEGDTPRFGTLGGVIYWDLPVLDEIEKILKSKKIKSALIVGEMAGYSNGKIIPFNESESIIKNPKADKKKVAWFPYQIIELNGEKFDTKDFKTYMETWPQLKKIFSGATYIHPVKDFIGGSEVIKKSWDKLVVKDKNEGIVIRTDDNKVYKCKPDFTYDLVIIAVGDKKKGKNWPKKMISMALLAFMDNNKVFRTAGHVASGFNDEESRELFSWAQKNKVGEDQTYVWVKPQKIVEIKWERSSIKEMESYKYTDGKYESVGKKISGTAVKPRFIRYRKDKSVNPSDLRLTQIPGWSEKKKMAMRIASQFMLGEPTIKIASEQPIKTWREIQAEYNLKFGENHHCLKLECTSCDNTMTCRCSQPKILEKGICYYCTGEIKRPEPLKWDL